jgi:hypothetical protein
MPNYMLLLYAEPPASPEVVAEREANLPLWFQLNERLEKAGLLVGANRLHPTDTATTVRVRDGETEVTDGPFAVTKEVLGGYYMLDCANLDEALKVAAQLPLAKFGSVEVRPVMDLSQVLAQSEATAQSA